MKVFALDEILLWWDGRRLFTFNRLLPAFETFGFLRAGIGSFQLLPLLDCWPDVPGPWRAAAAHMRKLPIVGVLRR